MRPAVVVAAVVVATSARALGVVTLRALVVLEVVRPAVRGRVLLVVAPRVVLVLIGTIVELRVVTTGPILGVVMRLVRVVRGLVVPEAALLAARVRTVTSVRLRAVTIAPEPAGTTAQDLGVTTVRPRGGMIARVPAGTIVRVRAGMTAASGTRSRVSSVVGTSAVGRGVRSVRRSGVMSVVQVGGKTAELPVVTIAGARGATAARPSVVAAPPGAVTTGPLDDGMNAPADAGTRGLPAGGTSGAAVDRMIVALHAAMTGARRVARTVVLRVETRLVRVVRGLVVPEAVLLAARARTATSVRLRAGMIGVDRGGMIGLGLVGVLVVGSRGTSVVGLGGLSVVGGTTGRTGVPTRRGSGRGATIPSSRRTSPGLNSTGA